MTDTPAATLTAAQYAELGIVLGTTLAVAADAGMGGLVDRVQTLITALYPDGWTAPAARLASRRGQTPPPPA